jgi:hypothetical protein
LVQSGSSMMSDLQVRDHGQRRRLETRDVPRVRWPIALDHPPAEEPQVEPSALDLGQLRVSPTAADEWGSRSVR